MYKVLKIDIAEAESLRAHNSVAAYISEVALFEYENDADEYAHNKDDLFIINCATGQLVKHGMKVIENV